MTFRTAKRKTEKSSDPGKFFLSPATEKCRCQGTLSVVRLEGGFSVLTLALALALAPTLL
jgi:hypothetical protein